MRPYLAVLRDSLREASSSWVLWILLGLLTILLILVAGIHVEEDLPSAITRADIRKPRLLVSRLKADQDTRRAAATLAVRTRLPEEIQQSILELDDAGLDPQSLDALLEAMNALLDEPDLYVAESWRAVAVGTEARDFLKQRDDLTEAEVRRLNRLILDATFPDALQPVSPGEVDVRWMVWSVGREQGMTRAEIRKQVNNSILPPVMNWVLGFGGVFLAILVARIIPQTFEPGEIDLLLSKPVSRPLLFLTKFFGGSMFILLTASYVICGLWLIVGWRFDLWNERLLLCIPIFLFLFSIYYCVSAYVGVVWRSPIAAVIVTIMFWACCLTVGLTRNLIDLFALNPQRLATIVPTTDGLISTNKNGDFLEWSDSETKWEVVIPFDKSKRRGPSVGMSYPMYGPIYDRQNDRLVAIEYEGFRGLERLGGDGRLLVATHDGGWQRYPSTPAPQSVAVFVDDDGEIQSVGLNGVHRFEGDPTVGQRPFKIAGFDLAKFVQRPEAGSFVAAGPPGVQWKRPFSCSISKDGQGIVVYSSGTLQTLKRDDADQYQVESSRDMETAEPCVLACHSDLALVAFKDGTIHAVSLPSLETIESWQPMGEVAPRQVVVSSSGRWFAVLFHDRNVWLYDQDNQNQKGRTPRLTGQGNITAVTFGSSGDTGQAETLYAADRVSRVTQYELPQVSRKAAWSPPSDVLQSVYWYAIDPLYTVFPKPGELDSLVQYALTDDSTVAIPGSELDLQRERPVLNVWPIIWSNLAFVACMLALTSYRVWRRDF